jgi:hypothetical protein
MSYECAYCKKTYSKESTLTSHSCERKRRFQQQQEIGVQWGFQSYLIFYETTQNGNRKTYEQFVDSSYYTAFVRFGRHSHSVHCPNLANFTRWLLKNNRRLDHWCSDQYYAEWLKEYLKRESVQDALERSIQCMMDYAHEHPDLRNGYRDYFRLVNENRICYHIASGRISPWAVYNCESGQDFLGRLNEDQVAMINDIIDPTYWQPRFRDLPDDVIFVTKVLKLAFL